MKLTEIRSKLDELYALTEADNFKKNDGTPFTVKDLQELVKEKVLELDQSVDRLENKTVKETNTRTNELVKLGARVNSVNQVLQLNSVASDSISLIKLNSSTETYANLASKLLSAQWDLLQQIEQELDDVSYILLNADELEQLEGMNID